MRITLVKTNMTNPNGFNLNPWLGLKARLEELLNPYDGCQLECDGLTQVLSTVLSRHTISHRSFVGQLVLLELSGNQTMVVEPHFWLELELETVEPEPTSKAKTSSGSGSGSSEGNHPEVLKLRVDYRVKMWLGDLPGIPHGIFAPTQYPHVLYTGRPVALKPLHPVLFEAMTRKLDQEDLLITFNKSVRGSSGDFRIM